MCSTRSAGIENCSGLPFSGGTFSGILGSAAVSGVAAPGAALAGAAVPGVGSVALGVASLADFGLLRRDPPPGLRSFATFAPLAFASDPGLGIWNLSQSLRMLMFKCTTTLA